MSLPRPYLLAEASWKTIRERSYEVAVLPWGATEAHNLHLPYGTDNFETEHIAGEAARLASERGGRVIVLPGIPIGVNTGQLDIPLCLNLNPSTQFAVLRDLVASVERAGIPKLVLLNGHGGNDFRAMIRELTAQCSVFLCTINWYQALDAKAYFDEPGDHAGELETSVMLSIAPELVLPLREAGTGAARHFRLKGLRDGLAWSPRRWTEVTDDTGVGDPRRASAEKGTRYVGAVTARIADFLVELDTMDLARKYE